MTGRGDRAGEGDQVEGAMAAVVVQGQWVC